VCERHNAGTTVPFAHFFRSALFIILVGCWLLSILGLKIFDKINKNLNIFRIGCNVC
jgi:hypothetical protein